MSQLDDEECASQIAAHRTSAAKLDGHALGRLTPDEAAGYAVQRRVGELLSLNGSGAIAGYKLGMTSPALLAAFGLVEPLYGLMHRGGRLSARDPLLASTAPRALALECEVAITLKSDLGHRATPYDAEAIASAIRSFHVAIEVVENRFASLEGVSPWTIVADGVLHRAYALGPGVETAPGGVLRGEVRLNGVRLTGGTSDALWHGGPIEALAWLANKLNAGGHQLCAGDIILCGSLGPAAWLTAGSIGDVIASIPQLGSIELRLV
jgi:2-keto-4-pentenoate hydratase